MATQRVILHMAIDSALKKALLAKAKEENRSLSNLVETALYRLVDKNNKPPVTPSDTR